MKIALAVLFIMTITLFITAYRRGDGSHIRGLRIGKNMFMGIVPLLIIAFIIAGNIVRLFQPDIKFATHGRMDALAFGCLLKLFVLFLSYYIVLYTSYLQILFFPHI